MLLKIYKILYREFGPQKWWPTTLEGNLHPTYHGKKISKKQRFEIIIGAILTQNTSWKNVEKAILNLNKNNLLDIDQIKKINKKRLATLIKPSGYYNQKAERLKLAAEFFSKYISCRGGTRGKFSSKGRNRIKICKANFYPTREQLLAVKGIGPETADSILLYAFNKPIFVIDAYTKRIFSRIGICKNTCSYTELQEIFHTKLPKKAKLFNEYHALLVELGKQFCTKNPNCTKCPITKLCAKF